jgi:hypothetical protein
MRDSYLEREVPTGVKEEYDDDVNETNVLGLTDVDIEFQVYNIEEMIHNCDRTTSKIRDSSPQNRLGDSR